MNDPSVELPITLTQRALSGLAAASTGQGELVLYQIGIRCGAPILGLAYQEVTTGLRPIYAESLTIWIDPALREKLAVLGSVQIDAEIPSYGPIRYIVTLRPSGESSSVDSCP